MHTPSWQFGRARFYRVPPAVGMVNDPARRSRVDFDEVAAGLSRVEVAVAFLALLDLRRADEIVIDQAAPFAPIRISRPDVERTDSWIAHSA